MAKPLMVLRNVKTTALTHTEHDQNFLNLRDATVSLTAGTGGTSVVSDLNGNITLVAGTNVTITGDNTAKTITINAANESQNIFQNIAVAGQSTVSADATNDTVTFAAGSNVTITTDAATDTITFAALGGLTAVVDDTTPQLGGDLEVGTFDILCTDTTVPIVRSSVQFNFDEPDVDLVSGNLTLNSSGVLTVNAGGGPSKNRVNVTSNITMTGGSVRLLSRNFFLSGDKNTYYASGGTAEFRDTSLTLRSNTINDTVASTAVTLESAAVVLSSFNFTPGGSTTGPVLTTSSNSANLTLSTNRGTTSGVIEIAAGANQNISITPNGTGRIRLNGAVNILATSGTPTTFENGYYEDMLMTPVSWLKIQIGTEDYFLPLFQ
jgi:hypothetical protein